MIVSSRAGRDAVENRTRVEDENIVTAFEADRRSRARRDSAAIGDHGASSGNLDPQAVRLDQSVIIDDMIARNDSDGGGRRTGSRPDRRSDVIVDGDSAGRIEPDAARRFGQETDVPVVYGSEIVDRPAAVLAKLDRRALLRTDVAIVGDGIDASTIDEYAAIVPEDFPGRLVDEGAIDVEANCRDWVVALPGDQKVAVRDITGIDESDRGYAIDGDRIVAPIRHGRAQIQHIIGIRGQRLAGVAGIDDCLGVGLAGCPERKRNAERNGGRRRPIMIAPRYYRATRPQNDFPPGLNGWATLTRGWLQLGLLLGISPDRLSLGRMGPHGRLKPGRYWPKALSLGKAVPRKVGVWVVVGEAKKDTATH
jgi:hypothetical protein